MAETLLLLVTCSRDVVITRHLLKRMTELEAWRYFCGCMIALDPDLPLADFNDVLRPCIPLPDSSLSVYRPGVYNWWAENRIPEMLSIYQFACRQRYNILKLDVDLYINDRRFFSELLEHPERRGLSGRLITRSTTCQYRGQQLAFIQGGIVHIGEAGRSFLTALQPEEVTDFSKNYRAHLKTRWWNWYLDNYSFTYAEDLVILGLAATVKEVPRTHIPDLQISLRELVDRKQELPTPAEILALFRSTDALCYHYESSYSRSGDAMNKALLWYYQNEIVQKHS